MVAKFMKSANTSVSGTAVAREFQEDIDELIALAKKYLNLSKMEEDAEKKAIYSEVSEDYMNRAQKLMGKTRSFL